MPKSTYKELNTEFNIFNKQNDNLFNKHQFVANVPANNHRAIDFGLLLPSMIKKDSKALEPFIRIETSVNGYSKSNSISDLHDMLLEYLDQALSITAAFQQGAIKVDESARKDTIENLFYIYQWYSNNQDAILESDLYELPEELDDRCNNESVEAMAYVVDQGVVSEELALKIVSQGKYLTSYFGNIFPLVAPDSASLNDIINAFTHSKLKAPKAKEYKNNGFARVEFNNVLEKATAKFRN